MDGMINRLRSAKLAILECMERGICRRRSEQYCSRSHLYSVSNVVTLVSAVWGQGVAEELAVQADLVAVAAQDPEGRAVVAG